MRKNDRKDGAGDARFAGSARRERPDRRDPAEKRTEKRIFIDLDDAYGVPFSSAPVSPQTYREP